MTKRYLGKLVWPAIGASIVAFLIYGFMPKPVQIEIARPRVGALQVTVDDDGETRIRESYVISAPVTGKMLRVDLHAGDEVVEGETEIARIEPSDPSLLDARTRAEAEARVGVAMAAHTQSLALVDRAKEALELAKREFTRAEKLLGTKSLSQAEFDSAENRLNLAYADLRSAESARRVAGYEIEQAEAAVAYITSAFDPTERNMFKVVSPINGTVLEVYREDSGVVAAGTPIVRIGDASDLEIVIDILSTDAVKVTPGDTVIIEGWGGEQPLLAVVRTVEPSAFLKVSALGVEEKRVNVVADFVTPYQDRQSLGDGFRIEAKLVVDETPADTLSIPAGVLFRQAGVWHAYRVNKTAAELIEVHVGRSNGVETEVLSGIDADDRLILHPSKDIQTGTRLQLPLMD